MIGPALAAAPPRIQTRDSGGVGDGRPPWRGAPVRPRRRRSRSEGGGGGQGNRAYIPLCHGNLLARRRGGPWEATYVTLWGSKKLGPNCAMENLQKGKETKRRTPSSYIIGPAMGAQQAKRFETALNDAQVFGGEWCESPLERIGEFFAIIFTKKRLKPQIY